MKKQLEKGKEKYIRYPKIIADAQSRLVSIELVIEDIQKEIDMTNKKMKRIQQGIKMDLGLIPLDKMIQIMVSIRNNINKEKREGVEIRLQEQKAFKEVLTTIAELENKYFNLKEKEIHNQKYKNYSKDLENINRKQRIDHKCFIIFQKIKCKKMSQTMSSL